MMLLLFFLGSSRVTIIGIHHDGEEYYVPKSKSQELSQVRNKRSDLGSRLAALSRISAIICQSEGLENAVERTFN